MVNDKNDALITASSFVENNEEVNDFVSMNMQLVLEPESPLANRVKGGDSFL